ncbi:MAG: portal protein [Bacteroidales bacterium]
MQDNKIWADKVAFADSQFKEWERKFKCKILEKYYEGFQSSDNLNSTEDSYVMNLILSTYQVKKPSLLFRHPIFYVDPQPYAQDVLPDKAFTFAQNCEDLLNSVVTHPKSNFSEALELALLDSGPYFGVVEVQFVTEWEVNPLAGMPMTVEDPTTGEIEEMKAERFTPKDEYIRLKHIPAHRFRVGGHDTTTLESADWCGYYDFIRLSDIKDPKNGFKNVKEVSSTRVKSDGNIPSINFSEYDENYSERTDVEIVKVWRIWDNIKKKYYIFTDGDFIELYSEDFERLPIFPLVFHRRRRSWYPIPLFFNWKPIQDEVNEARQQIRSARRRARRLWTVLEGSVDQEELDKLTYGPDGTVVWVKRQDSLMPVPYPPLDSSIGTVLQVSKDDFNIISGTSAEARGQADRVTATQAAIVNQRSQVREADEREIVATWLAKIGKEVIKQAREHYTMQIWVKYTHNPGGFFEDVPEKEFRWKQIMAEDLGTFDFSVSVSVESLSPVAQDQEKRKFMEFLAILGQYQIVAMHPDLILEAAYRTGYRNMRVIRAFQQAAALQMVGQISGVPGMQPANPSDNIAQQTAEQMTPPTQAQIEGQLNAMGVPIK